MDYKDIQRLKALNQNKHKTDERMKTEFIGTLQRHLASKGHRADLVLIANVKDASRSFKVQVKYNTALGHPTEKDLMSIASKHFADKNINWDSVSSDTEAGIITLLLEPSTEIVPLKSINEIPPEFTSIGTCIYKRAADASGTVNEIWELGKTDHGLALVRKNDDLEILAEDEDKFKKGDVADTPYGPGVIQRFDDLGNAVVLVGSKNKLVAQKDLLPYSTEKEKQRLLDYYTQIYGKEFAQDMLEKYSE